MSWSSFTYKTPEDKHNQPCVHSYTGMADKAREPFVGARDCSAEITTPANKISCRYAMLISETSRLYDQAEDALQNLAPTTVSTGLHPS